MPEEIADSDAESDYENSPPRRDALPSIAAANSGPEADPADDSYRPFEIDFSQFVTQSSTSQKSISQNDPSKRSTSSTDRLLRGIGDAQHELAGSSSTKTLSVNKTQHTQPKFSPGFHSSPTRSQNISDTKGPLIGAQLDGSPVESSRKRRHTEAQWTSDQIEESKKKKRAKTYGNSKVQAMSSPNDLFAAQPDASCIPIGEDSGPNTASWPDPSQVLPHAERSLMPPPADWNDDDGDDEVFVRQRHKPRRVISLLDANTTDPSGEVSMTRSSMGGYQSINLDFRGSTHSLAIDTNPFGEPSQISVDDTLNPAGTQKLSNGSLNDATLARAVPGFDNPPDSTIVQQTSVGNAALDSTDVVPSRSRSIDPNMLFSHIPDDLPHDTQLLSSSPGATSLKRRKTYHNGMGPITSLPDSWADDKSMHKFADDSSRTAIVPKKRGRKPKNQRPSSTSPAPTRNRRDEADEHEAALDSSRKQEESKSARSRASTTIFDSEDQQPEQDAGRANKKGKKKVSRANNNTTNMSQEAASNSPVKQLSSELNLSDEALIGLPKENYKPRPSRSRRGTTDSVNEDPQLDSEVQTDKKKNSSLPGESKVDHTETANNESSSIKQLTSKLILSDEVAIGIPKENYEPRPSRSRSKRIIDHDEASVEQARDDPPQKAETEEGDNPPTTQSKKKGKKVKVKRAKTSATALLKSQQMFSDGEDDVIYMDEKPSKVKLDLPLDIKLGKTLKQENGEESREAEETSSLRGDNEDDIGIEKDPDNPRRKMLQSRVAQTNFTIELPPPPDTAKEPPKPEPKKRGRKRKKPLETPPDEAVDEASSSEAKSRPALKDRDPNLQPHSASNDPTRRSEPASTPSPQKEKPKDKENVLESTAATTPLKPSKESSSVKGPTKHSPINPPGTKTLYRVGLSRRAPIPSLLKIVRKDRPVPAAQPKRGKKKTKDVDVDVDAEPEEQQQHAGGEDDEYHEHQRRDADGMGAMRRNPATGLLEEYFSD